MAFIFVKIQQNILQKNKWINNILTVVGITY